MMKTKGTNKEDGEATAVAGGAFSRRRFGQLAMLGLAGGALVPRGLLSKTDGAAAPEAAGQVPGLRSLSAKAQAEVRQKLNAVFTEFGSRLSPSQKQRIRFIVSRHVQALETVRAISVRNGDAPATVLKLATGQPAGERGGRGMESRSPARQSRRGEG